MPLDNCSWGNSCSLNLEYQDQGAEDKINTLLVQKQQPNPFKK